MNKRFPVLSIISILLRVAGWILTIVSAVLIVNAGLGLFSAMTASYASNGLLSLEPLLGPIAVGIAILWFATAVFGVVLGLITVAFGEIIGVIFAIEDNTRRAAPEKHT
jgi:hypothetical protein